MAAAVAGQRGQGKPEGEEVGGEHPRARELTRVALAWSERRGGAGFTGGDQFPWWPVMGKETLIRMFSAIQIGRAHV